MCHQQWYETVCLEEQFLTEKNAMINAQEIIDTCNAMTRHYTKDDPMRMYFLVGILETKIRELVTIVNNDARLIQTLNEKIDEVFQND